ncbi:MAG: cytochrome C oxidase subunit III [Opitutus sp.]|nr:cytochrome C oxidase subunit III [Opitutus sp.]
MNPPSPQPPGGDHDEKIRPHTYDGIQEYDSRLPNWWLYTLYGAIAFWIVYWFAYEIARIMPSDTANVDAEMSRIAAVKMSNSIDVTDDGKFWEMAQNATFVEAGKSTFVTNCAACHLVSLKGKSENPAAIGPNLIDTAWVHGGTPKEVYKTVAQGVLVKGMPAWEPVLGQKKTVELVAYILSHHQAGEPITVEASK